MRSSRFAWIAVAACAAVAAFGVYAPAAADRWLPAAGPLAHRLHDRIWAPPARTAAAPGEGEPGAAAGAAPIVVTVTPVKRADYPVVLQSIGQVQAYNTVLVRARVDGQIMKIAFREGQTVNKGDLLAQIDPDRFRPRSIRPSPRKRRTRPPSPTRSSIWTASPRSPRRTSPPGSNSTPRTPWCCSSPPRSRPTPAAIDAARTQLDYTTIRAPISGRAGFRLIDEGNLVNAGQQTGIVSIAQLQPIAVIFASRRNT